MNVLRIGLLKRLLKGRWFPLGAQLGAMTVLALLIAGGLGVTTTDGALSKELRNTNLANLIVWSYWWPLIIVAAILLGRVWCTVCPVELLTFGAGRISLRRKMPRFLKSGWVITGFYALVLIVGIHTLAIHRIPHRMAIYLLTLGGVAVAVSLLYGKRAFCSHVCPVGHLLGLYAMISPLEWRADNASTCRTCKTKDCSTKQNQYRFSGRSCTSDLYPAAISDNRRCLACTQCLKACPHDNLRLSTRRPLADFFQSLELRWAEIGFVMLVSGFVVYEILSEWSVSEALLKWLPNHVAAALGATGSFAAFVGAVVMFAILPTLFFVLVATGARIVSGLSIHTSFQSLSLLLLPTMGAAHIFKALLKMSSRIPYWDCAVADPSGVITAQRLVAGAFKLDTSVPTALGPAVTAAALVLLLGALVAIALMVARAPAIRSAGRGARAILFIGAVTYWAVFAVTTVAWRL